jgi:hypothetical protein
MANQIKVAKTIYSLQNFNNVVNTSFSQLAGSAPPETPVTPDLTVSQFFNEYDILFYEIPLSGSDESHLALATRSLEYLGLSLEDLQSEINELREENVNLKNQILLASQIDIGTQV